MYCDAVLFRLMTGWRAENSREEMLKYLCELPDINECEAEFRRDDDDIVDEPFSAVNASA